MARTVHNAKIDSRSARAKLSANKSAYWTSLAPGCALGYRKGAKGGVWLAKIVKEDFRKEKTIGPADDAFDADGVTALSYADAQEKARQWISAQAKNQANGGLPETGPYTVSDAVGDYIADYKRRGGKALQETRQRADAFIIPTLGAIEVARLTSPQIRGWHEALAKSPPRLRSKIGKPLSFRDTTGDPEAERRRRATANRTMTVLKAALNHAFNEGKAQTDEAWRRTKPFREADAAKVRYLSHAECKRLVNSCDPAFRPMMQAALLTGCRYGELAALHCHDFDATAGTVSIRVSKSGKPRHVVLASEGIRLFEQVTNGKLGGELIFVRPDKKAWGKSHQFRYLREACAIAKIEPAVSFHILRHSYASHLIQAGAPLPIIAANLGHADTRMTERHYAHLSKSYVAEVIRAAMPTLDIVEIGNVTALDTVRAANAG
jgi:integrase